MNKLNKAILIILLALAQLPAAAAKDDDAPPGDRPSPNECLECHETIWNKATARRFVHVPFQRKECVVCHAADTPLGSEDSKTDDSSPKIQDWTGKSLTPASSHWLEFTTADKPATMILEATHGSMVRLYREIPIPPLKELANLPEIYQDRAPMINDVKILAVERGVFLTATISWRTDRPTTAGITYWIDERHRQTLKNDRLRTDHLETISALREGETYRFLIVAEDSLGNSVKSDIYEFSTAATFSSPELEEPPEKCCLATPLGLESRFYRKDDRYLVNITLARPVRLFFKVKSAAGSENQAAATRERMEEESPDIKHIIVNEQKIISLIVCKKCHRNLTGHHPVNVFPKGKRGGGFLSCPTRNAVIARPSAIVIVTLWVQQAAQPSRQTKGIAATVFS